MPENDQQENDKPLRETIPQKSDEDYFQKGQQGITPPKPANPNWPNEGGGLNEGSPGWTPPKNGE